MNGIAHNREAWTRQLGLAVEPAAATSNEQRVSRARRDYLASIRPTEFIRTSDGGDIRISLEQVVDDLKAIDAQVNLRLQDEAKDRRARGWTMVRAALEASDAEVLVDSGEWIGFSRGQAIAWCWNLYQFEPHGFLRPAAQLRAEGIAQLEAGLIPDGFGYARRAKQLEAAGMTPETYRQAMDALGKPTFTPGDVRF